MSSQAGGLSRARPGRGQAWLTFLLPSRSLSPRGPSPGSTGGLQFMQCPGLKWGRQVSVKKSAAFCRRGGEISQKSHGGGRVTLSAASPPHSRDSWAPHSSSASSGEPDLPAGPLPALQVGPDPRPPPENSAQPSPRHRGRDEALHPRPRRCPPRPLLQEVHPPPAHEQCLPCWLCALVHLTDSRRLLQRPHSAACRPPWRGPPSADWVPVLTGRSPGWR